MADRPRDIAIVWGLLALLVGFLLYMRFVEGVPVIYSGAGVTLYHGNAPCADGGLPVMPPGFTGGKGRQRREATYVANLHKDHEGRYPYCCYRVVRDGGGCLWVRRDDRRP